MMSRGRVGWTAVVALVVVVVLSLVAPSRAQTGPIEINEPYGPTYCPKHDQVRVFADSAQQVEMQVADLGDQFFYGWDQVNTMWAFFRARSARCHQRVWIFSGDMEECPEVTCTETAVDAKTWEELVEGYGIPDAEFLRINRGVRYAGVSPTDQFLAPCCGVFPWSTTMLPAPGVQWLSGYQVIDATKKINFDFPPIGLPRNKFVVHTLPNFVTNGGQFADALKYVLELRYVPHFLVAREAGGWRIAQLIPLDTSARQLKRHNEFGAIQVAVTYDATVSGSFTNAATPRNLVRTLYNDVVTALAGEMPMHCNVQFRPWGAQYTDQISEDDWKAGDAAPSTATGLIGHQHAPGELRWDPGNINPALLLT